FTHRVKEHSRRDGVKRPCTRYTSNGFLESVAQREEAFDFNRREMTVGHVTLREGTRSSVHQ
ncbi:MAG TPA: hypothetical protein VFE45_08760, partial [Coriobacteriia bacterium]|nr:hypothetical protein [Coriobacteriia bacterium]